MWCFWLLLISLTDLGWIFGVWEEQLRTVITLQTYGLEASALVFCFLASLSLGLLWLVVFFKVKAEAKTHAVASTVRL